MNKLLWLLGGTALAVAVFAILNEPDLLSADGVDRFAAKVGTWGTKQRAAGAGGNILGKVEQFAGNLTGNRDASDQGTLDQASGAARNAVGQVAEAAGKTISDLNKA